MNSTRFEEWRRQAISLREERRLSNKEIWDTLGRPVAKITVAGWVRHLPLSREERSNKLHARRGVKTKTTCQNCGKNNKSTRDKFCSASCATNFRYTAYIKRWLAGQEAGCKPSEPDVVSGFVRRYLFEINGDACSACGWSKRHSVTLRVPLQVDHIDGNPRNQSSDNLRLLCPNCHSLTETFGALNKGNGRWARRRAPVTHGARTHEA